MVIRILLLALLVAALFAAYVRVTQPDPSAWHVDPETEDLTPGAGVQIHTAQSPIWTESPEVVLSALADIADETPRTTLLAGDTAEAHVTFETRSLVFAFPDYTTVKAVDVDGGTALSILARLRYGSSDLGVNGKRVEAWMAELAERLPPRS